MGKKFFINVAEIPGKPVGYYIFDKRRKPLGNALIIENDRECLVWSVDVLKKHRRKGVGSALLMGIQETHDSVVSSWVGGEGFQLAIKCGFKVEKSPKGNSQLVWRKGIDDATKQKGQEDKESDGENLR